MATTFEKNAFAIFRFSLVAITSKMQMHKDPHFSLSIYSQHTYKVRYDSEKRQLAFKYEMRNPESGADDGKEENDGMLVLKIVTVKHLEV